MLTDLTMLLKSGNKIIRCFPLMEKQWLAAFFRDLDLMLKAPDLIFTR